MGGGTASHVGGVRLVKRGVWKSPPFFFHFFFQTNFLFQKLVILVRKIPTLFLLYPYLPLFTPTLPPIYPLFFEFTRFIHTLANTSHEKKSFCTFFEKKTFFQSILILIKKFLKFYFILK